MEEKNMENLSGEVLKNEPTVSEEAPVTANEETPVSKEVSEAAVNEEVPEDAPTEVTSTDKLEIIDEPMTEELIEVVSEAKPEHVYRWNYNDQLEHDNSKKSAKKQRGNGVAYAIILASTFVISLAILFGTVILGDYIKPNPVARDPMEYSDSLDLSALYDFCLPSYVAISTSTNGGTGTGSGIIITEDGYISTNYHVVADAEKITVILSNDTRYTAEYIDGDEMNDIAVIKINARGLIPAEIGSSANSRVGERVMAIGTPYSISYASSMTSGYISGIDRKYAIKNDNGTVNKVLKLIQTDTSVNPGNSGGPLFNMNGEVIGIITMKIAGADYEGMNFALPIDGVIDMIYDIIENGKITSSSGSATQGAALGISGVEVEAGCEYLITEDSGVDVKEDSKGKYIEYGTILNPKKAYLDDEDTIKEIYGEYNRFTAEKTGFLIMSTQKGFDSETKLQPYDILMSANGTKIDSRLTIQEILIDCHVGDVVNFEVYRNGQVINVLVSLGVANDMN